MIKLKRAYDEYSPEDGYRILADRLWPRGLTKEEAHTDLWLKDLAPSDELRKWFGHDPAKWPEFQKRYLIELKSNPALKALEDIAKEEKTVTLIYAAKDTEHNEAVVLKDYLEE